MDTNCPLHQSPRRELQLQGPRPAPLRVSKDSHQIKKPPLAPREPVIIYTISPKVIHVDLADFMGLVQRLTGPPGTDQPSISPAAKLAAIHNASAQARSNFRPTEDEQAEPDRLGTSRPAPNPGILSPVPASLPPVSPGFFSPSYLDPGFLNFLYDLSPTGLDGGRASGSGLYLPTPSFLPSPAAPVWDLFKH